MKAKIARASTGTKNPVTRAIAQPAGANRDRIFPYCCLPCLIEEREGGTYGSPANCRKVVPCPPSQKNPGMWEFY